MAVKKVTAILSAYFNAGDGVSLESEGGATAVATLGGVSVKRSPSAFLAELKAMTTEEKRELAEGVCAITGDTIAA